MKVQLKPAPGAILKITTAKGETLTNADISMIEVEPLFTLANGPGEVFVGEAKTDEGVALDKFQLVASGANGKVKRANKAEKVVPLVDRKKTVKPDAKTPPATPTVAGRQEGGRK